MAQDKLPLGLFFGAGCPLSIKVERDGRSEPLIPDIAGLTAAVSEALCGRVTARTLSKVRSHFIEDSLPTPNIEQILSHTRALMQIVGAGLARGLDAADLTMLEQDICREVSRITNQGLPNVCTPYHDIAAWAGAVQRLFPLEIFTTNYDLLMEEALEQYRIPYFDGFVGGRAPFFDTHAIEEDVLPPRWVRIWKLHGSINWRQAKDGRVCRTVGDATDASESHIIHPSHLKYSESRRMPYLVLIDRLRFFLRRPSAVLIVCGYSFGDEHINEVIIDGLSGNASACVFALLYGNFEQYESRISLAGIPPNLTLMCHDDGVVGGRRATWQSNVRQEKLLALGTISLVQGDSDSSDNTIRFHLGDFSRFGAFASEVTGSRTPHATRLVPLQDEGVAHA